MLTDSTHIFEDHDVRDEAERLLRFVLDAEPEDLEDDAELGSRARERYLSLIARRAGGEPFPFLVRYINFDGLDLDVRPGAFVPRPSSELLVSRAVRRARTNKRRVIVDVCTGAGPIALALAHRFPQHDVWGLDISEGGLRQARRNARKHGMANVTFRRSDMYGALPEAVRGAVDLITAHVPYVPRDEVDTLPAEVKEHEPLESLTDESDDGLFLMRRAIEEGAPLLSRSGWLLLEMSEDMAAKARRLCRAAGLDDRGVATDRHRLSVVVEARKKPVGRATSAVR